MKSSLYKKYMKHMAYGGNGGVDYSNLQGIAAGIGSSAGSAVPGVAAVQQIGTSVIDAVSPTDQYGVQSDFAAGLKGTLQSGPVGAVLGLMANNQAKNQRKQILFKQNFDKMQEQASYSNAAISSNPSLVAGNKNGSMFAGGGPIGGIVDVKSNNRNHIAELDNGDFHRMVNYSLSNNTNPLATPIAETIRSRKTGVFNDPNNRTILDAVNAFNARPDVVNMTPEQRVAAFGSMQSSNPIVNNYRSLSKTFNYGAQGGLDLPVNTVSNGQAASNANMVGVNLEEQTFNDPKNRPPKMGSGGSIHIKKSHEGRFTAYKQRTGKTTEEALHSSNAHVRQMANFANNASKWHHKANGGTVSAPLSAAYLNGGTATNLSSTSSEINGPSHADGGVDIPQAGVQVEGGETTSGNFVFSHKLGFAQQHKPIAKAIGIIEEKPMTPERVNALRRLKTREHSLALSQEYFKKLNGIQ